MAKSARPHLPADLTRVKRYSIKKRPAKSEIGRFGKAPGPIPAFLDALPDFLKAADLKSLAKDIIHARNRGRAIIWLMGAHPFKLGLSPLLINLLNRGYISTLSLNGAGIIHDLENAFWGRTSEEVADTLSDGLFGMVKETPKFLAEALSQAKKDVGLGRSIAEFISLKNPRFAKYSVLRAAYAKNIPVTVHIGIGTETISQHPEYDAGLWGAKSHLDFRLLATSLKSLNDGGVVLNIGSAVFLPEVFLKALTVARNLYGKINDFSAANFDMIQHYRPNENVVNRPTIAGGKRYVFTGHHEIMLPLLAAAIKTYER